MMTMLKQTGTSGESRPVIENGFPSLIPYYLDKRKIVNDNILISLCIAFLITVSWVARENLFV